MMLTAANTAIVLDSTSDVPEAPERFPNMRVVPLYVNFGAESFRDHVEISSHDFYDRLRNAPALPTTSQPTPQDFLEVFEQLAHYERIFALHLSAQLSGTFQSSVLAAGEIGGDRIQVVDTETASLAVGLLALAIQRRLARGTNDEEIAELIDRFKRESGVVFTVGTLEYLQKGGRIGRAQALAGTILNVKPILSIRDGCVNPIGKVRGRQKALEEFGRVFTAATEDRHGLRLAIAHADAPEWIDLITDLAAKTRPRAEIELVENLGAVVGTHAGPGSVGFFWFQD
jgi:DegV family protein with EDD domain